MHAHVFRLERGADLLDGIKLYAQEHALSAAAIVGCAGCVSCARFRCAGGIRIVSLTEPLEITSLSGTLCPDGAHLHASFAREDATVIGGHLLPGCIVDTTAEIVLLALPQYALRRAFDPATGYRELICQILQECE